jgi:hypothetical protein
MGLPPRVLQAGEDGSKKTVHNTARLIRKTTRDEDRKQLRGVPPKYLIRRLPYNIIKTNRSGNLRSRSLVHDDGRDGVDYGGGASSERLQNPNLCVRCVSATRIFRPAQQTLARGSVPQTTDCVWNGETRRVLGGVRVPLLFSLSYQVVEQPFIRWSNFYPTLHVGLNFALPPLATHLPPTWNTSHMGSTHGL